MCYFRDNPYSYFINNVIRIYWCQDLSLRLIRICIYEYKLDNACSITNLACRPPQLESDEIYNMYKICMELDLDLGTIKTYYEHVYSRVALIKMVSPSIINPIWSTDETLEGIIDSLIHSSLFINILRVGLAYHIWAKFA
jgi:hypothetical protein